MEGVCLCITCRLDSLRRSHAAQVSTSVLEFGLYPGGSAGASNDSAAAQAYAASLQSNTTFRDAALLPPLRALGVSSDDVRALGLVSTPEVVSVSSPAAAFVVRVSHRDTWGHVVCLCPDAWEHRYWLPYICRTLVVILTGPHAPISGAC
jgi:hypothetical protein